MNYYKLLQGIHAGKVVSVDSDKNEHFTYVFGKEDWIKTNIFVDYIWFQDDKFGKYQQLNKSQAQNLIDIQRQQLTSLLRLAKKTAKDAHKGQVDIGGNSYIDHPEYVANHVDCLEQKIVAWLHDVLEDTKLTEEDLRQLGFTESIIYSVKLLTRVEGMDYEEYLWRLKSDKNARAVKLVDLEHNMDISRLGRKLKKKDKDRLYKYEKSLEFIK